MNKTISTHTHKAVLLLVGLMLGGFLQSCGPDEEPAPVRSVNKALLTDKDWYLDGELFQIFHSNGTYNNNGSWQWLNNSDSMKIVNSTSAEYVLHFEYIEEEEMKCGTKRAGGTIYTTSP